MSSMCVSASVRAFARVFLCKHTFAPTSLTGTISVFFLSVSELIIMAALTEDEERFYRLVRILLDDIPDQLRPMFKAKFQAFFRFTWGDNRMSGEFFVNNFNSSHMPGWHRPPQHITDVIRLGDTEQFDPTTLFTCLLFSGTGILVPTPRSKNARSPPIEDSERLDELRVMRNMFAHAPSASVSQTDFNQKLTLLNIIYAQLHWNPTLMRKWARDPFVTAECARLQQQLNAERQRYGALDGTVQALAGM